MKFSTRELDKYLPMTTGYKLDHICVMLEKIVDGIGHPQVILAGDLIDQPLWTEEHTRLYEENARLRDQLRWHSVDEKPPVSGKYLVKHFLRNQDGELRVAINITYYTAHNNFWLIDVIKWCYIPEDNQGTDCTPEGGDE